LQAGEPSKQHVLNCLNRLQDKPRSQTLMPPPALRLVIEPKANTARYDDLKEQHR